MRRTIILVVTLVVLFFCVNSFAGGEDGSIVESGAGCLEYPSFGDEFTVWGEKTCNGGGFGAIVTKKTKIIVNGKSANKRDLFTLSKKQIQYLISYHKTGSGDGVEYWADELFILSEDELRMQ